MITDVEIENYQAIERASLELGKFTVITGPTGSGKSAVIRAIRLVAFNARGTSYIRHGARLCKAALGFREEQLAVGIERGGRGQDKYRITSPDLDQSVHAERLKVREFTKLGGGVPEPAEAVLRLEELNFAGQFDRPYLLDATGGQVARVLGELTNVTLVFDAAREAARRKLETARDLRRAEGDLESLKAQARQFRTLRQRRSALQEAQGALEALRAKAAQLERLRTLAGQHKRLSQGAVQAQAAMAGLAPPSADRMIGLRQSLSRLRSLQEAWSAESAEKHRRQGELADAREAEEVAHWELHVLLAAAGVCPTCGQRVPPV